MLFWSNFCFLFFFFKQKTAYEMRISDWSSDVCSSDLVATRFVCRVFDPHSAIDVLRDHACTGERSSLGVPHDTRDLTGVGLGGYGDTKSEKNDAIGRASCRERVCQYV